MPFIRATEIKNGEILTQNILHVAASQGPKMQKCLVSSGEMILVRSGVNTGDCAVVPSSLAGSYAAYDLILRFTDEVNPSYVSAFLDTEIGRTQLNILKARSAQPHLNAEEVSSILLPLPPPDVQRRLVAEMQAARAARQAALAQADALLAGLDAYLLNELGLSAPQGQRRDTIGVTLKQLRGNRIDALPYLANHGGRAKPEADLRELASIADIDPNTAAKPKDDNTLVPYVGLPECDLTQVREVVMRPYREVRGRSVVRPGDILFARIEPSVFNRKYVLADDLKGYEYAYTSTEFYVVRAKEEVCVQNYLYAMLHCSFVFSQVIGITTGSSGRRRVDLQLFQRLDIPVPNTLQQQEAIAAEVTARREKARDLRAQAAGEWEAAKARFERQLLGEETLP